MAIYGVGHGGHGGHHLHSGPQDPHVQDHHHGQADAQILWWLHRRSKRRAAVRGKRSANETFLLYSSSSTSEKPADKIPNSFLYFVKTIDEQKSRSIFSHVQSVSFKSKANLSSWFLLSWNSETFDFLNVRPFKNKTNASSVSIHLLTLVPHKSSYHVWQKPQFQCETHIRIITVSPSGEDLSGQGVRFPGPLEGPLHIHLPTKSPTKNIQLKYKYKAKVTILLSIIYIYIYRS